MKSRLNVNIIGNIFYLDKHLRWSEISKAIILTLIMGFFAYLFEGKIFDLKDSLYVFLGLSLVYLGYNYKALWDLLNKYYKFNIITLLSSLMEIILAMSFIIVYSGSAIGYIFAFLWLSSGMLRVLIQATPALFYSDINELLKAIQIFAYSRAAYFSIILLMILDSLPSVSTFEYSIFLTISFLLILWLIANLNPYMIKHSSVKNSVELIRLVNSEGRIKLNRLKEKSNFSDAELGRIIKRWDNYNLIELNGNRVELSNYLQGVKNEPY